LTDQHHRVSVVFDKDFGSALTELAERSHVWLVDSPANSRAAAEVEHRRKVGADALEEGVTVFRAPAGPPPVALDALLELIEDHHGEYAHDPPVDEILVIGLTPNEQLHAVLGEWGYFVASLSGSGLLARRR